MSELPKRFQRAGACPRWIAGIALCLLLSCSKPAPPPEPIVVRGRAMGTSWQVRLGREELTGDIGPLEDRLVGRIDELEQQLSHWRADSHVSRFNRHSADSPVEIPHEMAAIVQQALAVHGQSGGAFDITAAPLVNRWGFGPAGRQQELPQPEEIERLLQAVGSHMLVLEQRDGRWWLGKSMPAVQIDLSAIAKGYAIDQMAEVLESAGIKNYLIELGGELRGQGRSQKEKLWNVGLETPDPAAFGKLHATVKLADAAIATSGNYRNFIAPVDGAPGKQPHVLDPRTGRPIEHELAAVSVMAATCMQADAWATALLVLGPHEGWQLAQQQELAVCFVSVTDSGIERRMTDRFAEQMLSGPLN